MSNKAIKILTLVKGRKTIFSLKGFNREAKGKGGGVWNKAGDFLKKKQKIRPYSV